MMLEVRRNSHFAIHATNSDVKIETRVT